ncbi:beta-lactamase-like protein [Nitzschia inconspicua]|uniref:Beta-lactamase-like protein n=1 Tax=Nitzschia inconspicua TaxID=303405 RepID=A0A9K3KG91_9STRA|nr:beta-lactamase-like protein [Nitzschia inconspicua]
MTSCVRVLSVQSVDSSPSLLIVGPDGKKTLINCGEGCQRLFLEFGQKISSIDRICLTHLQHDAMGGLPGMILTAADVMKHVTAAATARKNLKIASTTIAEGFNHSNKQTQQSSRTNEGASDVLSGLQIHGPIGTRAFVHSLRHFMRRDDFYMDIHEGTYRQELGGDDKSNKKRKNVVSMPEQSWFLESIVTNLGADNHPKQQDSNENGHRKQRQALSYLFTTPPITGRFLADKAKELGIPKGPLYGKLKAGQSVTFPDPKDPENSTVTIESHQVVEPKSPGIVVAVLYYPSVNVWNQLRESEQLKRFQQHPETPKKKGETTPTLELVIHMAPFCLFQAIDNEAWRTSFGNNVQHLVVGTDHSPHNIDNTSLSAFHSASVGTWMRSQLSSAVYHRPNDHPSEVPVSSGYTIAVPLLEYLVIPRGKRGFQNSDAFVQHWQLLRDEAQTIVTKSGCLEEFSRFQQSMQFQKDNECSHHRQESPAEILFTGTGSAIPCKYRNVSGIVVKMDNGNAIMLDCGEGTVGQLLRAQLKDDEDRACKNNGSVQTIKSIKAVWISHPHADHHLGILRLLSERRAYGGGDPLLLIAPPNLGRFLKEYEQVVPEIAGTYNFLDCRSLGPDASSSFSENLSDVQQRLKSELGILSCDAIPVAHCQNSFAVVFHGTSFGSLAYSGDCRPSMVFAEVAQNADILIHEATFADGLEADAVMKRHCTVGEALKVAEKMKAKTLLLTHFSQRYPKIPPLPTNNGVMDIIPAFDFMKITHQNMSLASQITPILRLLYPDEDNEEDDNEVATSAIEAAMDVPGLFAQKDLL